MSAWSSETGVTLAQAATREESNEITEIPEVLGLFAVKGGTVTIDAMGYQKEIAIRIRQREKIIYCWLMKFKVRYIIIYYRLRWSCILTIKRCTRTQAIIMIGRLITGSYPSVSIAR